jgi:hypothetical protein
MSQVLEKYRDGRSANDHGAGDLDDSQISYLDFGILIGFWITCNPKRCFALRISDIFTLSGRQERFDSKSFVRGRFTSYGKAPRISTEEAQAVLSEDDPPPQPRRRAIFIAPGGRSAGRACRIETIWTSLIHDQRLRDLKNSPLPAKAGQAPSSAAGGAES